MATSAISPFARFPRWSVSDAKLVGGSFLPQSRKGWMIIFIAFLTFAVLPFLLWIGSSSYQGRIERAMAQGKVEGRQSAQVELSQLRLDLASAKGELRRKQLVLDAETARKNTLAVENTKLRGEKVQAVSDLNMAMNKLRAIEAKQPPVAQRKPKK